MAGDDRERQYASIAELAAAEGVNSSYASRIFRLALLAPDLVETVLDGRQVAGLAVENLRKALPVVWAEQRATLMQISN